MKKISLFIFIISFITLKAAQASDDYLRKFIDGSGMTSISLAQANDLFQVAILNPQIRMDSPDGPNGGKCGDRKEAMEAWLKSSYGLNTGTLGVGCPADNIVGKDRSTGKVFKYSNYHLANIVLVKSDSENELYVMDAQFTDGPVKLNVYLQTLIQGRQYVHFSSSRDGHMPIDGDGPCKWFVMSQSLSSAELDR